MQPGPKTEEGVPYCCICLDEDTINQGTISLECSEDDPHVCCQSCLNTYINEHIVEKKRSFLMLSCPHKGCKNNIAYDLIEKNATEETKSFIEEMKKTIPKEQKEFYTLADFNYEYNDKGELRNKTTGEKFYYITENHYSAMGECIIRDIQEKMKNELNMEEFFVDTETKVNNIFISKGALEKKKLMLLIQGSGAVRPGQWARALCFNDTLRTGSQLEYIERAYKKDYGVIVFNPNENERILGKKEPYDFYNTSKFRKSRKTEKLKGSESKVKHTLSVYDRWAAKAKAEHIVIVAHSAGGYCTQELVSQRIDELHGKLKALAFTDAFYSISERDDPRMKEVYRKHGCNWVASDKPLNEPMVDKERKTRTALDSGCEVRSAGHKQHEMTSACCIDPLFEFIEKHVAESEES